MNALLLRLNLSLLSPQFGPVEGGGGGGGGGAVFPSPAVGAEPVAGGVEGGEDGSGGGVSGVAVPFTSAPSLCTVPSGSFRVFSFFLQAEAAETKSPAIINNVRVFLNIYFLLS